MKIVLLLFVLFSSQAMAMYGDLLPLDLAPNHACRISLDNGRSTCSGTIMSPTILKTASHCLRRKKPSETKVICPNGQEFGVKKLILHPDYGEVNNRMLADVGLIVLDQKYRDEIPGHLDERGKVKDLMENSPLCAVWGYGYNIQHIHELGHFNGVALSEFRFDQSHVIIPNSPEVMIRSGDSGGGLFCLDGNQKWMNVATVYGHDYKESFLLRNDYIRPFLKEHGLNATQASLEDSRFQVPTYPARNVQKGQSYSVRPFSMVELESGDSFGIGDQKKVTFKVTSFSETHAIGTLRIRDIAPQRYMCVDEILCRGTYPFVKIPKSRLEK